MENVDEEKEPKWYHFVKIIPYTPRLQPDKYNFGAYPLILISFVSFIT